MNPHILGTMSPTSKGSHSHHPRTTLATVESLTMPLEQELVLFADFRCSGCQQRVTEIVSKMSGDTQSMVFSVLEKKLTVVCTYPTRTTVETLAVQHATPSATKASTLARRLFRSFYNKKRALTI